MTKHKPTTTREDYGKDYPHWDIVTSVKCLYTNAHRMGNKQEKLEICVQSWGFNLTEITETWWDSSQDWDVVMESYILFRRDRPGRSGGGVALYVRKHGMYRALSW